MKERSDGEGTWIDLTDPLFQDLMPGSLYSEDDDDGKERKEKKTARQTTRLSSSSCHSINIRAFLPLGSRRTGHESTLFSFTKCYPSIFFFANFNAHL